MQPDENIIAVRLANKIKLSSPFARCVGFGGPGA